MAITITSVTPNTGVARGTKVVLAGTELDTVDFFTIGGKIADIAASPARTATAATLTVPVDAATGATAVSAYKGAAAPVLSSAVTIATGLPPVLRTDELGPATLARKWVCFVDMKTSGTDPVWVQLMGVMSSKLTTDSNKADTTDRDARGDKSQVKTSRGWGFEFGVMRKTKSATEVTVYDPAQEFLRMKAEEIGIANFAHVMVFEDNGAIGPKVQAYEGQVTVDFDEDSDGLDDPSDAQIVLGGSGKRKLIAHPLAAA